MLPIVDCAVYVLLSVLETLLMLSPMQLRPRYSLDSVHVACGQARNSLSVGLSREPNVLR